MANIALQDKSKSNKMQSKDAPIHNWYQFILGYPPHLVRYYIKKFGVDKQDIILDPFCGTGTTPVEALLNGISCYGVEANPISVFVCKVKTYKEYDPEMIHENLAFI